MDIFCKVTAMGFVPLDDVDFEAKKRLKIGSNVKCSITQPRNIGFHKKFFALLTLTFDNLPETVQQQTNIYSIEAMLTAIKIDLGYFDIVNVNGNNVVKLRSISFSQMDETQFEKFYDLSVTTILNNYLVGTNRNDLLQEVKEFIGK